MDNMYCSAYYIVLAQSSSIQVGRIHTSEPHQGFLHCEEHYALYNLHLWAITIVRITHALQFDDHTTFQAISFQIKLL